MSDKPLITVNGKQHELPDRWCGRRLLDFLRIELELTGTKEGCGEGDCGACTVLVDGEPQCACLLLTGCAAGGNVVTVEGLPDAHCESFANACEKHGGVQCGFCSPAMTVMAWWLANGGAETGNESIEARLAGNICRCTGYNQLLKSFEEMLE